MKKRFNVYSMGVLILEDIITDNLKRSLKRNKTFFSKINNLNNDEVTIFKDPKTGRQWEFERIK